MIGRILRMVRIEFVRVSRQRLFVGAVAAALAFAALVTYFQSTVPTEEFEIETTAFRCFLDTMQHTSLIVALAAFLLGSLSIAQEVSGRTVQNWLLCPLRRSDLVLGKALALVLLAIGLFAATGILAIVLASALYDFTGVSTDGYELVSRTDMIRNSVIGLALTLLPLAAWSTFGMAISAATRSLAPALATAGFVFFGLAFVQFAFADLPLSDFLFSSYTARYLEIARDMSLGIADAYWDSEEITLGIGIPFVSAVAFLAISLVFVRRAELRG